jgi:phage head maturation protease
MSFAFSLRPNGEDWAKDDNGQWVRTLKNLRLFDVSPVTYPAYTQTDVAVAQRSLGQTIEQMSKALQTIEAAHRNQTMDILIRRQKLAAL